MKEWMAARAPLQERLEVALRAVDEVNAQDSRASLLGTGDELRESWPSMTLDQKRAVIRSAS